MNDASSKSSFAGSSGGRASQPFAGAEAASAATERERLEGELRVAQARLVDQEKRFMSIVERSVDGVIVLDAHGWVLFANAAAEALFGRRREDLVGTDFGYPAVAGEITEIDVLSPNATPRVAEMRVVETTWEDEQALLVLIRDVTDRKATEERERHLLREQVARAEAEAHARQAELLDRLTQRLSASLQVDELLRGLADAIVEELGDVCIIDVDDQHGPLRRLAAARRGYSKSAVLRGIEDRPVRFGMHTPEARVFRTGKSELLREVTPEWLDAAEEGDEPAGAFRLLAPCSMMMVTLYAGALRWGVVSVLSCEPGVRYGPSDLSLLEELVRRAGLSIENARLYRLAQEASRAKSDFLAIVSHELRTPLSAVVGYTGLLEEGIGGSLQPVQKEYLGAVRRSAEHLIRLIEQVITFARLEGDHERVEVERVHLGRVAADVATLTRPMADRKGLTLTVRVPDSSIMLSSDEKKIAQILVNLVANAIKYTERGEVIVDAELEQNEVVIRVTDTGLGIPEDKHTEIFEPFRQLANPSTRREGGTGIGLSIVKNLTQLLGGEVGVRSRLGEGSVFTVRLPREHGAPRPPAEPSSA
jgi:signal transduction histidine kinase